MDRDNYCTGRFPATPTTDELDEMIRRGLRERQPLEAIRTLLAKYPDEALQGGRSLFFLTFAIQYRAPLEVIRYLVESLPSHLTTAASEQQTYYEDLPIHYACKYNPENVELILYLSQKWPRSVRRSNSGGYYALHLACASKTPCLETVQCLVASWPESISQTRCMPLHVACTSGASFKTIQFLVQEGPKSLRKFLEGGLALHQECQHEEVVQYLVEQAPDTIQMTDKAGNLPLHLACNRKAHADVIQYLVTTYPQALGVTNSKGVSLPLHVACEWMARLEVIQQLVQAWPDALSRKNADSKTPLHLTVEYNGSYAMLECMLQWAPAKAMNVLNDDEDEAKTPLACLQLDCLLEKVTLEAIFDSSKSREVWDRLTLFLWFTYFVGSIERGRAPPLSSSSSFSWVVHAAASTPSVPLHVLYHLCRLFSKTILTEFDHNGFTPLLLATRAPTLLPSLPHIEQNAACLTLQNAVLVLLAWDAQAAATPDAVGGSLPLAHALVTDKPGKVIQQLIRDYPESLHHFDESSSLFMFQVAAVHSSELDTVYKLLRQSPSVVSMARHGIDST
jgi:ankyrin repeat protein